MKGTKGLDSASAANERATAAVCRFGFVAFERKEDCQRALAMCGKNMFLIGNSARPVVVEMARTEVLPLHHITPATVNGLSYACLLHINCCQINCKLESSTLVL